MKQDVKFAPDDNDNLQSSSKMEHYSFFCYITHMPMNNQNALLRRVARSVAADSLNVSMEFRKVMQLFVV